jgi:hypothetical protein
VPCFFSCWGFFSVPWRCSSSRGVFGYRSDSVFLLAEILPPFVFGPRTSLLWSAPCLRFSRLTAPACSPLKRAAENLGFPLRHSSIRAPGFFFSSAAVFRFLLRSRSTCCEGIGLCRPRLFVPVAIFVCRPDSGFLAREIFRLPPGARHPSPFPARSSLSNVFCWLFALASSF